jgi:NAD(P)-dependent dehydrogenase (short-subunit alcohol dehydrogenase family)
MRSRVVIVGASRGLGHALALRYLDLGWEVWAGCRSQAQADQLRSSGATVHDLDVTDEQTIARFGAAVAAAGPIDLLINSAGIDARSLGADADARGPFDLSIEHFLAEVQVNAGGPMLVTRALLDPLLRSQSPKIVNVTSRTASMTVGAQLCWDIGYNASKAALNAVTVRTAHLLAGRAIVVAIHPGWIRTDMGGADATLEPDAAAQQLVTTIDRLTADHTGCFLQADGTPHPW